MHKILYCHMNDPLAGQTKNVQNYINVTHPDGHIEVLCCTRQGTGKLVKVGELKREGLGKGRL